MDYPDSNRSSAQRSLLVGLTQELGEESDRAAAILAAAYLDHLLGELIVTAMPLGPDKVDELLYQDGRGPLGTFSARIDTVYCLGLLGGDDYRDLHLIRKIRNAFAHKLVGLSFDVQSIADRCRELKAAQVGGLPSSPRQRFTKAAVRLMVDIELSSQEERDKSSEA